MNQTKKNTSMLALFTQRTGNLMSMEVDDRAYNQLRAAFEEIKPGCKLMVRFLPQETREKFKNPDSAPNAFLDILSVESVAEYKAGLQKRKAEREAAAQNEGI